MAIPAPFLESLGSLPGEEATAKIFLFTAEPQRTKIAEISSAANSELYSDPQVRHGLRAGESDARGGSRCSSGLRRRTAMRS
jgi:hypothetical protein